MKSQATRTPEADAGTISARRHCSNLVSVAVASGVIGAAGATVIIAAAGIVMAYAGVGLAMWPG